MSIEILVALINFHIGSHVLLNPVLNVRLSIFEIIINKMRIVHYFLQEMRSIDASTNKYWFPLNYLVGRGCKSMLIFAFDSLVFYDWGAIINYCFISVRFYIKIKSIIGGFHIHWTSFRLVQSWPLIPFLRFFRLECFHVLGWFWYDVLHVQRLYFFLSMVKIRVENPYSLISSYDVPLTNVNIFVSKP